METPPAGEVPEAAQGEALPHRFCSNCGAARSVGDRFCASCGTSFAAETPADHASASAASPGAGTPAAEAPTSVIQPESWPSRSTFDQESLAVASPVPLVAPPPPPPPVFVPPAPAHEEVVNVYQYGSGPGMPGAGVPVGPAVPPSPGVRRSRSRLTVQVYGRTIHLLPIVGAVLVFVATALAWVSGFGSQNAYDTPFGLVGFLIHPASPVGTSTFKIGVLLDLIAGVGIGLTVLSLAVRRLVGLAAMLLPVLYAVQLHRLLDHDHVGDFFGHLGAGPYVAFVGGLLMLL
jgi:hypothetical protein